jgi:cell wall-associated NlpC family hydrolase
MTQRFFLWLMSGVLSALIVGCSSAPKPLPSSAPVRESKGVLSQDKRQDVVIQSMAMLDRNYTYGGKKLHTGFDCSGLVSFVYKQSAGVALQGSAADMAKRTRPIDAQSAQPGDLVFFNTLGTPNSHVGIYIGSGKFIHAANERTGVRQERLDNNYWSKRFEGFRTLN